MFARYLEGRLPKASFFLFGPRQVGKSTLLNKENPNMIIDLLDPKLQLSFNKTPNLLRQQIDDLPEEKNLTILIDEIQRVPKLLDVVHSLMEQRPHLQFILCGSSARKLRHGASNLLGGRALYRTMHPLTLGELSDDFNLERILSYGSLPKIYSALKQKREEDARDLLRAYAITYLREEIKAEALVRNLQGFQNFLDVAVAQYAEQINFSGVSRDCQVALSTVREYYAILEDTLIGFFLHPHFKSQRKRMSRRPKFYFFDNGVTRALLGTLQDHPSPLEKGRLFEQWVVQEIMRFNEYHKKDWKLSFWRTSHGAEVDLLISRGTRLLYAIECKYKHQPATTDLSGLRSFHESHRDVPCLIVAPVNQPFRLSFARVLPLQSMLKELS
jgi:predicted AAA+ superfamily ATPase